MSARTAHAIADPASLRPFLAEDAVASAYMLGDLDPLYAGYCTWYASAVEDSVDSVLLVYEGLSAPTVLTHGTVEGQAAILEAFVHDLPDHAHAHLGGRHAELFASHFELRSTRIMSRMAARRDQLTLPAPDPTAPVVALGHRDTAELMELSRHYPESFFEPSQLSSGHYYGVRRDGRLVSMAGVHSVNAVEGLAVLGNVVTHPDARGHGLSTACTGHLCGRLAADGFSLLALNVERANRAAVRVYEKLGFREHHHYLEASLARTLAHRVR